MPECEDCGTPVGAQTVGAFHLGLVDVNVDGELDLVTANAYARNCLYIGNGLGYFGSVASPGDGLIAHQFAEVVPNWTGLSDILDIWWDSIPGNDLPPGCVGLWTIPGAQLRMSTGVTTYDVNMDGLKDVAFSNRADLYENMELQLPGSTVGLPPVYDHLYVNKSTMTSIAFPAVEFLGDANDHTAYGILAQINTPHLENPFYIAQDTDRRVDWLDANFTRLDPDGDGVWSNDIYFGHRLVPKDVPIIASGATLPFAHHLSVSRLNAQGQWHLLASFAGVGPPAVWNGGPEPVEVPLVQDCLFTYSTGAGALAGSIPNSGIVNIQGSYTPALGCSPTGAIYFCVVVFKSGFTLVSNVIRVPIQ